MLNIRYSILALLICSVLCTGCSSDDDPISPPPPSPLSLSGSVGTDGGMLQSADGKMSLNVPPGVLSEPTEISIDEVAVESAAATHAGFSPVMTFEISPTGLDLGPESEWTLTFSWNPQGAKGRNSRTSLPVAVTVFGEDSQVRSLPDQLARLPLLPKHPEANATITVRGIENGSLAVVTIPSEQNPDLDLWVGGQLQSLSQIGIGDNFALQAKIDLAIGLTGSNEFRFRPYAPPERVDPLYNLDEVMQLVATGEIANEATWAETSVDYYAESIGQASISYGVQTEYQIPESFWETYELIEVANGVYAVEMYWDTEEFEVVEFDPVSGNYTVGLWPSPMSDVEAPIIFDDDSDIFNHAVLLSGANGASIYNLLGDIPLQTLNTDLGMPFEKLNGTYVISLSHDLGSQKTNHSVAIGFGPTGATYTEWVPGENRFGQTQLFALGQNVTDSMPVANDVASGGYVYTEYSANSVTISQYDSQLQNFVQQGPFYSFTDAEGSAVSAYVREQGSLLVLTDSGEGEGHLHLHDRANPDSAAPSVGMVGFGPRRVRVLGNIGVVSNFVSGSLTIFTWDAVDNVTITSNISVGDGPIGIDLVGLPGDEVGIVSTGFNDNTWSITVVDGNGALVSNVKYDLPEGGLAPGHAIFADDQGQQVMVTCNGSDHVLIADSGLVP